MSWTATISQKVYNSGTIRVDVLYSKGEDTFSVVYPNIKSFTELQSRVQSKLKELENLDVEVTKIPESGPLELPVVVEVPPTEKEMALNTLYELKEKVSLGIIKESDQEFIDAVAAYKATESKLTPVEVIK